MLKVDLDNFLQQATFPDDESNRIFCNDVFISHRQFDKPLELIQFLASEGVKVAWDYDLDLRDRRVVKAVSKVMSASYCLALYVSDSFEDSLWCKAEYTSALKCERYSSAPRLVIILQSENSRSKVPSELRAHPCFIVEENLETLAAYLREGNLKDTKISACTDVEMHLETDLLSEEESLRLLEQRLEYWIESSGGLVNVGNTEKVLSGLMGLLGEPFSELENILREVRGLTIGDLGDYERAYSVEVLNTLVSIAKLVARSIDDKNVSQVSLMSSSYVYDFMLCPLLCAALNDATRFDSSQAYESICQQLVKSPEADLVPIYRRVLESVIIEPGDIEKILSGAMVACYQVRGK